jgi:hypothetical protein
MINVVLEAVGIIRTATNTDAVEYLAWRIRICVACGAEILRQAPAQCVAILGMLLVEPSYVDK